MTKVLTGKAAAVTVVCTGLHSITTTLVPIGWLLQIERIELSSLSMFLNTNRPTLSNAHLPNNHARQGFARGSVYMATMWLSAVHPHPPFPPTAWPQEGGLAALIFQKISATAFMASKCGQDKSHVIMRTFSVDLRVADFS